MKLTSFEVDHFRNLLTSGKVLTPDPVTCLVGKNESGKTNLLQALYTLNPALSDRAFDEQEYPRWLQKEHQRTGQFAKAEPIAVAFVLEDHEVHALEEKYGPGVLTENQWTCAQLYSGQQLFDVTVDEQAACREIEQRSGTDTGAIKLAALLTELEERAALTEANAAGAQVPTERATKAKAGKELAQALYPDGEVSLAVGKTLLDWVS